MNAEAKKLLEEGISTLMEGRGLCLDSEKNLKDLLKIREVVDLMIGMLNPEDDELMGPKTLKEAVQDHLSNFIMLLGEQPEYWEKFEGDLDLWNKEGPKILRLFGEYLLVPPHQKRTPQ